MVIWVMISCSRVGIHKHLVKHTDSIFRTTKYTVL
jgi:hypothetical protein